MTFYAHGISCIRRVCFFSFSSHTCSIVWSKYHVNSSNLGLENDMINHNIFNNVVCNYSMVV